MPETEMSEQREPPQELQFQVLIRITDGPAHKVATATEEEKKKLERMALSAYETKLANEGYIARPGARIEWKPREDGAVLWVTGDGDYVGKEKKYNTAELIRHMRRLTA